MQLKNFQELAINKLKSTFYHLWKSGTRRAPLIFKSPTGSGKTIMMAEFLKRISGDMQFEVDKAFVWISFNEDSYVQSKEKLYKYYNHGVANLELRDMNDLNNGLLQKNEVFFINWQKLVSRAKDNRRLRTSGEQNVSFDEFIKNTHAEGREIVLIVDEAHIATHTELSQDLIDILNPRIEIHVSATPSFEPSISDIEDGKAGFMRVKREDVVEEGLIKESVEIMSLEEIEKVQSQKGYEDQDELLIDLAFQKKQVLAEHYNGLELDINPLILIQLPNDDKEKDATQESKLELIKYHLKNKGRQNEQIAIWLSDKKENLEAITKNNSEIDVLIFKQAAATGWDCPRAQILVMFREIKKPMFKEQVIGRALRMPEAKHYSTPELNKAYLYTNYESNQIQLPDNKMGENKPSVLRAYRKQDVELGLESTFIKRAKYGDLGDSFQQTFVQIADEYFGLKGNEIFDQVEKKLNNKGLETKAAKLTNNLIVNAKIECFDEFQEQLQKNEETLAYEASRHDTEKTYNLLLYKELAIQESEDRKFAPERSWPKLKTALNIWLKDNSFANPPLYEVIAFDLQKEEHSIMRKVIGLALEKYKPLREKEEQAKVAQSKEIHSFQILDSYGFTEDYEVKATKKSILEPFYIRKQYDGRKNEESFIDYLEASENVDWWFQNGDYGRDYFSIEYTDEKGNQNLFYPDFIVATKDGRIGIFDTKDGMTVTSKETKHKSESLQEYFKEQNKKGKNLWGGIVVKHSGIWKVNQESKYQASDIGDWGDLTL